MYRFYFLLLLIFSSCLSSSSGDQQSITIPIPATANKVSHPKAKTIGTIPLPPGFKRIVMPAESYGTFLRNLPLKEDNSVYLYNGELKKNQSAQFAVLDLDVGNKDLQQCADAVIRLSAEYLFQQKKTGSISFRLTNGFHCDYNHYAQGYRLQIRGNSCSWIKKEKEDYSYPVFRQYLDLVYTYAGTQSLHHQLTSIPLSQIHPGSVFLQARNPYGHAVTVMDMACHPSTQDTIFLLSQSYMPAQDIHVLLNPEDKKLSPWYSTRIEHTLQTPEWTFTKDDLKEF